MKYLLENLKGEWFVEFTSERNEDGSTIVHELQLTTDAVKALWFDHRQDAERYIEESFEDKTIQKLFNLQEFMVTEHEFLPKSTGKRWENDDKELIVKNEDHFALREVYKEETGLTAFDEDTIKTYVNWLEKRTLKQEKVDLHQIYTDAYYGENEDIDAVEWNTITRLIEALNKTENNGRI